MRSLRAATSVREESRDKNVERDLVAKRSFVSVGMGPLWIVALATAQFTCYHTTGVQLSLTRKGLICVLFNLCVYYSSKSVIF